MTSVEAEFDRAVAPALADLGRTHPGLVRFVRVDEGHPRAWVLNPDDTGMGLTLDDGRTGTDAVHWVTEQLQEAVIEALWGAGKSAVWPVCPLHPNGHPLSAVVAQAHVVWQCPVVKERVCEVGALGLDE